MSTERSGMTCLKVTSIWINDICQSQWKGKIIWRCWFSGKNFIHNVVIIKCRVNSWKINSVFIRFWAEFWAEIQELSKNAEWWLEKPDGFETIIENGNTLCNWKKKRSEPNNFYGDLIWHFLQIQKSSSLAACSL